MQEIKRDFLRDSLKNGKHKKMKAKNINSFFCLFYNGAKYFEYHSCCLEKICWLFVIPAKIHLDAVAVDLPKWR